MTVRRVILRRLKQFLRSRQSPNALSQIEDPELLLQLAQEQMIALHAKNRERAVAAITQKNNLENMVRETERRTATLHLKARVARDGGDEALASQIMCEEENYRQTLEVVRETLKNAIVTADQVKLALRREEDRIRRQTAEMAALRTQWKLVQIERALTISLAQITASGNEPLTRARVGERHRRSREMAIEAITQKNFLATLASETQQRSEQLRRQAESARRAGEEDEERLLLRELEQQEAIRAATDAALSRANVVTTRARALLDEEAVRVHALNGGNGNAFAPADQTPATDAPPTEDTEGAERRNSFFQRNALLFVALALTILMLLLGLFA